VTVSTISQSVRPLSRSCSRSVSGKFAALDNYASPELQNRVSLLIKSTRSNGICNFVARKAFARGEFDRADPCQHDDQAPSDDFPADIFDCDWFGRDANTAYCC
jgi:hypothetical protein